LSSCLHQIEAAGLYVDTATFEQIFDDRFHANVHDSKLFSEYSLFTATGRPSNKFGGINFAALNTKDDTRKSFVSRFGDNGLLFDIDFKACHPHLIAQLIGYVIPKNVDIYEYLGNFYFNTSTLTTQQLADSKVITFRQLYGHVDSKFKHIPYFAKKQAYTNEMLDFFKTNGFIKTPIFNRKMDLKNFGQENPEKMFAYLLQSFETEANLLKGQQILRMLQSYRSKLVLYTYDSFLIDFCKDDPKELILDITVELEKDNTPVSVKSGTNFKELKKIAI